jgi:hypothetical protein
MSTGQIVREIVAQYYSGLARISVDVAANLFNERLALSGPFLPSLFMYSS